MCKEKEFGLRRGSLVLAFCTCVSVKTDVGSWRADYPMKVSNEMTNAVYQLRINGCLDWSAVRKQQ